ncbi:hypothetical protein CEXT_671471 [Caerostris extrusa]|uniref:Uncharacterized protein n=1 Tax=Caerostris extrusa TaxID=172846 RepID=A0AAV4RVJ4_CAEEX|nr:hypothetical protein CEXT_671471 [Caerostris extrusa]
MLAISIGERHSIMCIPKDKVIAGRDSRSRSNIHIKQSIAELQIKRGNNSKNRFFAMLAISIGDHHSIICIPEDKVIAGRDSRSRSNIHIKQSIAGTSD